MSHSCFVTLVASVYLEPLHIQQRVHFKSVPAFLQHVWFLAHLWRPLRCVSTFLKEGVARRKGHTHHDVLKKTQTTTLLYARKALARKKSFCHVYVKAYARLCVKASVPFIYTYKEAFQKVSSRKTHTITYISKHPCTVVW